MIMKIFLRFVFIIHYLSSTPHPVLQMDDILVTILQLRWNIVIELSKCVTRTESSLVFKEAFVRVALFDGDG